ncbi:unnamed protein product [Phyllotreta striolata]|uniref:arginine kinase n=1 Tax=Phyllotreta striolata TaxID=444603 RepID=A0A9N9TGR2_PHYSR|nr:unnamed protein product [Phyllotreta striolata]
MPCNRKCELECCGKNHAHPAKVRQLECKFKKFQFATSDSLLKKYLTSKLFEELKWKKTNYLMTLLDCVLTGFENPDSSMGVYAGCPECYDLFGDLFDELIREYHGDFKKSAVHPPMDWGEPGQLQDLDPEGKYIISTRVRTARSLKGYPFNPGLSYEEYLEIEEKIVNAVTELTDDLKGQYVGLRDMTPDEIDLMVDSHVLYKESDRFLNAANAYRYWPAGRGYFYNEDKTFIVWVNEEDHMRVISMQEGGNLGEIYDRLAKAIQQLDEKLEFERHERLGFLSMCPTNVGTGIRASVHIKLPNLAEDMGSLEKIAEELHLQIRGSGGEHTASVGGILDVSNKRRLGLTEREVIQEMNDGVLELIRLEGSK